ncbi:MAG: DUF3108 domain-containing protein [candidate division WOR-3 bacterium]
MILFFLLSLAFSEGEELVFHVYYGAFGAGIAYLRVLKCDSIFHFQAQGHTNKFFSIIFYVNDRIDTYSDSNFLPLKQEKNLHEGTWKKSMWYKFDYDSLKVYDSDGKVSKMEKSAYDVLSIFYKLRNENFKIGDTLKLLLFADRKIYKIYTLVEKKEKLKTLIGEKDAIKLILLMEKSGEYKGKSGLEAIFGGKGGLEIWVSDDEKKVPLYMSTRVWFGSVRAVLKEIRKIENRK